MRGTSITLAASKKRHSVEAPAVTPLRRLYHCGRRQHESWDKNRHPVIGERILGNVEDYAEIATIVRHHYERVDGKGYPDAITGTAIPQISRIICVTDAYKVMTSGDLIAAHFR